MILEDYEIIDDDKIVISKSELEVLLDNYKKMVDKYHEGGDFYNVVFYNGKYSLLIDILKTFK